MSTYRGVLVKINEHRNDHSILNQEEYTFKMFAGEDKNLQHYLLLIKLSETKRHLVQNNIRLADYMMHLIISYRKLSVRKGLVFSSKAFRRKSFIKQAGSFIKELRKH
jgi:hypothetical protein